MRGGIPGPEAALAKVTTIRAAIGPASPSPTCSARRRSEQRFGALVSDMPGLKSAGGTEEILRSMVGERVLGLPPEPRVDKAVPFCELRAGGRMNFALSDEQELLQRGRARGALAREDAGGGPRRALDGDALLDLWPVAVQAGWPGLLVGEAAAAAPGSGVMDALLVFAELGRVLARTAARPPPGHPAARPRRRRRRGGAPAAGTRGPRSWPPSRRAAVEPAWTVEPGPGFARGAGAGRSATAR